MFNSFLDMLPLCPAYAGPVNPPMRTAMDYALFDAYVDRVPYTFIGRGLDRRVLMPLLREEDDHDH
jgi:hypothetical protein